MNIRAYMQTKTYVHNGIAIDDDFYEDLHSAIEEHFNLLLNWEAIEDTEQLDAAVTEALKKVKFFEVVEVPKPLLTMADIDHLAKIKNYFLDEKAICLNFSPQKLYTFNRQFHSFLPQLMELGRKLDIDSATHFHIRKHLSDLFERGLL